MQTLLLVQDDELAVLVGLLQDVLALLDVAVVVLQAEEGGHQRHVGLNGIAKTSTSHILTANSAQTRFFFFPRGQKGFEVRLKDWWQ